MSMIVRARDIPDVVLVDPRPYEDERGAFFESWQQERYEIMVTRLPFRQDSVSVSQRGVVRGLHFQHPHDQGKLVSVLAGAAYDVAVDVRRGSPTFGKWVAEELSAGNRLQLWIPPGFAHGLQALVDGTVFHYKCTDIYHPEAERTVHYADPALGIPWPIGPAITNARDGAAPRLADLPPEALPAHP